MPGGGRATLNPGGGKPGGGRAKLTLGMLVMALGSSGGGGVSPGPAAPGSSPPPPSWEGAWIGSRDYQGYIGFIGVLMGKMRKCYCREIVSKDTYAIPEILVGSEEGLRMRCRSRRIIGN